MGEKPESIPISIELAQPALCRISVDTQWLNSLLKLLQDINQTKASKALWDGG